MAVSDEKELVMERNEIIQKYHQQPEVDVLIIGAGINGIGTFRDLALQGVSVLMIDRADLCAGASAASTRLAHGGLRYLENGEFRLVRESLIERNRLLKNAPHAVHPIPFTVPIYSRFSGILNAPLKFLGLLKRPGERGAVVIKIGLTLYDWFTRSMRMTPTHHMMSRAEALKKHPGINPKIIGAGVYYDALMPYTERIGVEVTLDAESSFEQAHALTYASVVGAEGDTVQLRDDVSGETFEVKPRIVINAAGAWIDFVNRRMKHETRLIGGTKGSHIIVDFPELFKVLDGHVLYFENKDGRLLVIMPLEDRVMIGTSDIRIDDPDQAICSDEEIDYFFTSLAVALPDVRVKREQIVYHFSGVRPLPSSDAGFVGMISRDHSIQVIEPDDAIHFPIYSLVGGKWTTFRAFAEQVTNTVLNTLGRNRRTTTEDMPIGGGKNYPRGNDERDQWLKRLEAETSVSTARLKVLFDRYGTRAEAVAAFVAAGADEPLRGAPDYSRREIMFVATNEKVVHLDDVILRRSLLGILGKVDGDVLAQLGEATGAVLGWTAEQTQQEIERAAAILQKQHGVSAERLERHEAHV
jgi:glycerol-3-phosphate dehydrogenase